MELDPSPEQNTYKFHSLTGFLLFSVCFCQKTESNEAELELPLTEVTKQTLQYIKVTTEQFH